MAGNHIETQYSHLDTYYAHLRIGAKNSYMFTEDFEPTERTKIESRYAYELIKYMLDRNLTELGEMKLTKEIDYDNDKVFNKLQVR